MIPLDISAVQRSAGDDPDWLVEARSAAFELFGSLDEPSAKSEEWRYVDLDFTVSDFALPIEAGPSLPPDGREGNEPTMVVVDGIATGGPSNQIDGAVVRQLAEALRDDDSLRSVYNGLGHVEHDKFSAAARAFGSDGVHVRVEKGAFVPGPISIDMQATTDGAVSFPRVVVEAEEGSQASVIVGLRSRDDIGALVVPEIDVSVGVNAVLRLTIVQDWGERTVSVGRTRIVAARDAQATLAEAGLGGAFSRLHLSIDLEGRGSNAQVFGAYFGDRDQVLDYRYFMRHVGENTSSDMFLKGGVEDEALSIFTGMIRIEESAQRTNAFQTNRNLLLSAAAAAQSVPNLEILANDVKCGHASTVGPLDEEQRYYLMSRGLHRDRADRLQVRGFFEEALARFPEQSVVGPIRDRINAKYADAQRDGRL